MKGRLISVWEVEGELALGLLRRLLQALERHGIVAQVHPVFFHERVGEPVDNNLVEVVAAQVGIAVGAQYLKGGIVYSEYGYVEGAATQIVYGNLFVLLLLQPVGQAAAVGSLMMRSTSRPAMRPASFVATLRVVEISRYGNNRLVHRFAEVGLADSFSFCNTMAEISRRAVVLIPRFNSQPPEGEALTV